MVSGSGAQASESHYGSNEPRVLHTHVGLIVASPVRNIDVILWISPTALADSLCSNGRST
jgi:hypothetical protein